MLLLHEIRGSCGISRKTLSGRPKRRINAACFTRIFDAMRWAHLSKGSVLGAFKRFILSKKHTFFLIMYLLMLSFLNSKMTLNAFEAEIHEDEMLIMKLIWNLHQHFFLGSKSELNMAQIYVHQSLHPPVCPFVRPWSSRWWVRTTDRHS